MSKFQQPIGNVFKRTNQVVLLLSGGMDSTVLLYDQVNQGMEVHALLCNYGQVHVQELEYAKRHCRELGVPWEEVELYRVKMFLRCALTDKTSTSVIVPFRNGVMLSIAVAYAASRGINLVAYACNRDDQAEFPDCRWGFIESMNEAVTRSETPVEIIAPYIGLSKRQIVHRAKEIKAPWEDTWSCYGDGMEPCGKCKACEKRKAASK